MNNFVTSATSIGGRASRVEFMTGRSVAGLLQEGCPHERPLMIR
jgi:hypothetical protein